MKKGIEEWRVEESIEIISPRWLFPCPLQGRATWQGVAASLGHRWEESRLCPAALVPSEGKGKVGLSVPGLWGWKW